MKNQSLLTIVMLILPFIASTQIQDWDGNTDGDGDGIHWSDPQNWVCDCVPAATDYARIIDNLALDINDSIVVDITTTVESILCYGELHIPSGITLTVTGNTTFTNGSLFRVNTGASFITNALVCRCVTDVGGIYDHTTQNYGNIQFSNAIQMHRSSSSTGNCHSDIYNYGTISGTNTNGIDIGKNGRLHNHGIINLPSNGELGLTMVWGNNESRFHNYGTFITNQATNDFTHGENHSSGTISILNAPNVSAPLARRALEIIPDVSNTSGSFINNGKIEISTNATGNIGLYVGINATFTQNDTLEILAQQYAIDNRGTVHLNGFSKLLSTSTSVFAGVNNNGTFTIGGSSDHKVVIDKSFLNINPGNVTINNCKDVDIARQISNSGSFINAGVIRFSPAYTGLSINNFGSYIFNNNGIMANNNLIVNLFPGENQGVFIQKILGQKCKGIGINNAFSGERNFSSQSSGDVFLDFGLTTYAGDVDFSANVLTPQSAAVNQSLLYMELQLNGCPNTDTLPIRFELPIQNPPVWYRDLDGDTYGNPSIQTVACSQPTGYVSNNTDCNDTNATVYPGAPELCDGIDNNCDGIGDTSTPTAFTGGPSGMDTNWFNSANWTAGVPTECQPVTILTTKTANIPNMPPINVKCKSIDVQGGATLISNASQITINGGTSFGIKNMGVINATNLNNLVINNIAGHAIDNSGLFTCNGVTGIAINGATQNGIQNNPPGTFTMTAGSNCTVFGVGNRAISNNGVMILRGNWSASNVGTNVFFNTGTLHHLGSISFPSYLNIINLPV